MITRIIEKYLKERLFQWKVIILYGARQVGKTTLSQKILHDSSLKTKYISCDLFSNQQFLDYKNPQNIIDSFRDFDLVVLDEAQNIGNIGTILKILVETFPNKQFIATGSSSFDLANRLNEPLTGRNFKCTLFPLSIEELKNHFDIFFIHDNLENLLIYGAYPEVFWVSQAEKQERLNLLAGDYLYRDIFKFEGIKKSEYVRNILQLLALQIWSEVSYNEIGQKLWLNHVTVTKYIDILEQAFIIFRVHSFSRNLRNEITKGVKIYFSDLWVRNSLINNFNPLSIRTDSGALWENFLISERKKYLTNNMLYRNTYFWRTHAQQEIDYIEEYGWKLFIYEFKYWEKSTKAPKSFTEAYPESTFMLVNKNNYLDFVFGKI